LEDQRGRRCSQDTEDDDGHENSDQRRKLTPVTVDPDAGVVDPSQGNRYFKLAMVA
jgi:hypothetical protein